MEPSGALLAACCMLVPRLAYSSTLMIETVHSFNTLVKVCQNMLRFIPETITFPTYHSENTKCNNTLFLLFAVLQSTVLPVFIS
jgi:hypothetical protein